jgi:hypothetical protein
MGKVKRATLGGISKATRAEKDLLCFSVAIADGAVKCQHLQLDETGRHNCTADRAMPW